MDQLQRACQNKDIPVLTQSRVLELWVIKETKRVGAVGYLRPNGQMEFVQMDALLLACNGFGGNAQLLGEFIPQMHKATYAGHLGNDGSALLWGRALGAQMADLGSFQGHGSWAMPQGALVTWALMMQGGIQVNALGQRFHNECLGYSEASVEVLSQPNSKAFNVFDEPLLTLARTFPDFCELERLNGVKRFDSVQALAQWIGCSPSTLERTLHGLRLKEQERRPGSGFEDERVFDRLLSLPLYAIEVTGALFHTQGGLEIDQACRVQTFAHQSLPNLWAGGGAARGVSGPAVWGYLSGNGLLSALASAYIAAHSIEAFLLSMNLIFSRKE
jgi:fumarate reductase flavoprotein subunit